MLNYLKAELYKLLRQGSFCVGLSLLILCEGLLLILLRGFGVGWHLNQSVVLLCGMLPFGFFLIFPLDSLVFSEQYKNRTLKNELSFGLSHARVYLGKLLAAAIVCGVVCLLAIGFFLGISWALCPVAPGGGIGTDLSMLGYCLLAALPVWLGALGLLHMLQFTVKNTTGVSVLYIAFFLVLEPAISMLYQLNKPFQNTFFSTLRLGLLSTPLENLTGYPATGHMGWAWLVGMGWLVATTIIGLALFRRSDIK